MAFVAGLASVLAPFAASVVEAKTPGSKYCYNGVCHRVKTLAETESSIGASVDVVASFYDDAKRDRFNPRNLTSSGEIFRPGAPDNAASPIYPDGTKLLVWNPATRQAAVIRINNAGPYKGNRLLDLSRGAADRLGFLHSGIARVRVRVVQAPSAEEATYRKGRKYEPVPGVLGEFSSLDHAYAGAMSAVGGTRIASISVASAGQIAHAPQPGALTSPPPIAEPDGSMAGVKPAGLASVPEPNIGIADAGQASPLDTRANSEKLAASRAWDSSGDMSLHRVPLTGESKAQRGKTAPVRVAFNSPAPRRAAREEVVAAKAQRVRTARRADDDDDD